MDEIKLDNTTFTPDNEDAYREQILSYIEKHPKNKKGNFQWSSISSTFNDNGLKTLTGVKWTGDGLRMFHNKNINKEDTKTNIKEDTMVKVNEILIDETTFTPDNVDAYREQIIKFVNEHPKGRKKSFQWKVMSETLNKNGVKPITGDRWDNIILKSFYFKKGINKGDEETESKTIKKISKGDMKKIIEYLSDNPMTSQGIANRFHRSLITSGVIKNVISNTPWKKVTPETPLPKGYFYPKNVKQTIYSVMYDLRLCI
jgi:hypothetical protein